MRQLKTILVLIAGSLALFCIAEPVLACPSLQCGNFTSDKKDDCNYVTSQALSKDDKQELLCILWEQSYEYEIWQPQLNDSIDTNLSVEAQEIDNSSFILLGKVVVFFFANYVIFSITKWFVLAKWLSFS
jgi:hypothetical protein